MATYIANPSDDQQTKIENAANHSGALWMDYNGKGRQLISAYDLKANVQPATWRPDQIKQYRHIIASVNDHPAQFIQPGKATW